MNSLFKPVRRLLLFLLGVWSLSSCDQLAPPGGVVLWSDNELVIPSGAVVESDGFQLRDPKTGRSAALPSWRWKSFPTLEEARTYADQYQAVRWWFATLRSTGIPLWSLPDPLSGRLSTLGQGQRVKILARSPQTDTQEGVEGWWYQVLTEGGLKGWVFEKHLDVQDETPGLPPRPLQDLRVDQRLESLFTSVWRPETLVESLHQTDLDRLDETWYFRGLREDKILRFRLPDLGELSFSYQEIRTYGEATYHFEPSGVSVYFNPTPGRITVYLPAPSDTKLDFRQMEGVLEDKVAQIRSARRTLYRDLLAQGPVLRSLGQGEFWLEEENRFRWVPGPAAGQDGHIFYQKTYGETGYLTFPVDLSEELKASGALEGIFCLTFDKAPETRHFFLYRRERGGLQLWPVTLPPGTLVLKTLDSPGDSYFFSFSRN